MSTLASIVCGSSVADNVDAALAGVGEDPLRHQVAAALGQRLGEAADAVAAHLGPAAVGVVEHHLGGVAVGRLADQQAVGADAAAAVAHAPRQRRQVVDMRVEHDEEVVAQPVVLGECERCHASSAAATIGPDSATGSSTTSTQRTRGSRWNHRSCRTANWRVRTTICVDGGVERLCAVEMGEQLLVAERLAGGARHAGRRQRPATSSTRPASIMAWTRCSMRSASTSRSQRRPICTIGVGGYTSRPGPYELNGRPLPWHTSSARTIRRRVGRLDLRRRAAGRARRAGRGAAPDRAGSPRRAAARIAGHSPGQVEVVDRRPVVEPGAADEDRPACRVRRCRRPRSSIGALELGDGEVVASASTRSSRWCGTRARVGRRRLGGADVHPAVHLHRVDRHQLDRRRVARRPRSRRSTCPTPSARRRRTSVHRPSLVRARRPGCARGAPAPRATRRSGPRGSAARRR